jgi:hypothetical protein
MYRVFLLVKINFALHAKIEPLHLRGKLTSAPRAAPQTTENNDYDDQLLNGDWDDNHEDDVYDHASSC